VRKNASAIQEKGYRPSEKVMGLIAEAEEWAKGGGKDAEKQRKGIKSIIQAAKLLAHECITGLLDQAYKTWEEYADEMTQVARARDEIMVPGSVVWEKQATRLDEFVLGWTKEKLDDLEERGVIDTHERDLADLNTAHIVSSPSLTLAALNKMNLCILGTSRCHADLLLTVGFMVPCQPSSDRWIHVCGRTFWIPPWRQTREDMSRLQTSTSSFYASWRKRPGSRSTESKRQSRI
jgi:hypothetical protein